ASALGRRLAIPATEGVTVGLVFFALALLVSGATTDLDLAARIHREATVVSRQTVDLARSGLAAGARHVVLVNFPAALARDGVSSFSFVNGLTEELDLKTGGGVTRPWLAHTYAAAPEGRFANGSRAISLAELDRLVADPQTQVLAFDAKERMVKELDRTTWRLPAEYTAASAPWLDWQTGAWPWLRAYAGEPLELPLAAGEATWVAVRYLKDATTRFAVQAGSLPPVELAGSAGTVPSWPMVTLPLPPPDGGPVTVSLQPRSEVWLAGVWSFAPPAAYTPESVPFLGWILRPYSAFTVQAPVDLPLARCLRAACAVRLEVLAEAGRDLAVTIQDGASQTLGFDDVKAPEWRTMILDVSDPSRTVVVHFEPRGRLAPEIRRLDWAP
ncbi:MAG TPA: hypothetical protein VLX28_25225, partial [Thermoanaerobaculia bacterium]|nr:hypothetical protein [Thermoanaerobaculia bacterium]